MSDFFTSYLFIETLAFTIPCWVTNMIHQIIWSTLTQLPEKHSLYKLTTYKIDFIFIDKKPFFGGFKFLNFIPILFLPFLFNLFNNQLEYFFLICTLVPVGDTFGSIIKRRFNFKPGQFMPLIDHGDYILLTGSIFLLLNYISLSTFLFGLLLTYLAHPIVCLIGYKTGFKNTPL